MYLRYLAVLAACALTVISLGCSKSPVGSSPRGVAVMGSPVSTGPLTYTVLHAAWRDSIETDDGIKYPQRRFLVVDLNVTNGGVGVGDVPLLFLIDGQGKEQMEEQKIAGLVGWLGLLRPVSPAQTVKGKIVFDVPMASYQLKVSSGGDPERETTALIDLPLRIEPRGVEGADRIPTAREP